MQINAEKAPFLVDRLKIWMLPTLALVKQEKTTDYVVGFDELGGRDDFPTEVSSYLNPFISNAISKLDSFALHLHKAAFCVYFMRRHSKHLESMGLKHRGTKLVIAGPGGTLAASRSFINGC